MMMIIIIIISAERQKQIIPLPKVPDPPCPVLQLPEHGRLCTAMLFTVCEQHSASMTQTRHTGTSKERHKMKAREREGRCSGTEANLNLEFTSVCVLCVFRLFRVRGHETTLLCGIQPLEGCGDLTQILYSCRQWRRESCRWSGDCWTELHCRSTFIMQAQGLFCEPGN